MTTMEILMDWSVVEECGRKLVVNGGCHGFYGAEFQLWPIEARAVFCATCTSPLRGQLSDGNHVSHTMETKPPLSHIRENHFILFGQKFFYKPCSRLVRAPFGYHERFLAQQPIQRASQDQDHHSSTMMPYLPRILSARNDLLTTITFARWYLTALLQPYPHGSLIFSNSKVHFTVLAWYEHIS